MKTLTPVSKRSRKNGAPRQPSRWIPGGLPTKPPTQAQIDRFNQAMDEIAAELEGQLPPDFAINHDHYIHGLPKRKA